MSSRWDETRLPRPRPPLADEHAAHFERDYGIKIGARVKLVAQGENIEGRLVEALPACIVIRTHAGVRCHVPLSAVTVIRPTLDDSTTDPDHPAYR